MPDDQPFYEIRVKGHLGAHWGDWFDGVSLTYKEDGTTILTGPVIDQAALHGLLSKIRDLNLPLLSVNCLGPDLGSEGNLK